MAQDCSFLKLFSVFCASHLKTPSCTLPSSLNFLIIFEALSSSIPPGSTKVKMLFNPSSCGYFKIIWWIVWLWIRLNMRWCAYTAWAHMFWGFKKPAEKSQAQVFYFLWDVFYFLRAFCILFYFFSILWVTAILAKCDSRFLQPWFCSVTSPCIFEVIHWSHPSHRAEIEFQWNFGVSICSIGKDILKFSSFIHHCVAAVPLLETNNILPVCQYIIEICPVLTACTWKNRVLLAAFWDKILIFHLGQTEHCTAGGDGPLWCTALRSY